MADDSNFLVSILLTARDEATGKIAALRAEIAALKKESEGRGSSSPTQAVARDLDNTGRSARAAEQDIRGARQEHERFGSSSTNVGRDLQKSTAAIEDNRSALSRLGGESKQVSGDVDNLDKKVKESLGNFQALRQEVAGGTANLGDARREYQALATDLQGLSRQYKTTSEDARNLRKVSEEARAESARLQTLSPTSRQPITVRTGEDKDVREKDARLKEFKNTAEETAKSYEMFDEAVRRGDVSSDDARRGYQQFAQELNGVAREFKATSEEALNYSRIASEAKSRAGDFGPSEAEINRVTKAYADFDRSVKNGEQTTSSARRGYKDFASELAGLGRAFRAGSSEAQRFLTIAEEAGNKAKKAGYLAPGDWNWSNVLEKTAASVDGFGIKIVSLSAQLRGVGLALFVGLLQQLDTAVVGAAGGLLSLASAAVQAGAAIGGALVAGISQAIPVLAVIGAAVERIKSVFQAVSLSKQVQTAASADPTKEAQARLSNSDAIANAEHSLQNAYEGVAVAQEHVQSSQEALTLARIDAIRNLADLNLAEKDAKLQAEGANLSLTESQRQLQEAIQSGNTAGIQSAQLGVSEAELSQKKAQIAVPRAEEEANRANRQGVGKNPSVVSATQALTAARKSLSDQQFQIKQAQDQLKLAEMQQDQPGLGQSSQQSQLKKLEAGFTPAEKALQKSLEKIRGMLESPDSPLAKLGDFLVKPITEGVERVSQLLGSKSAMKPLEDLAASMGRALGTVERSLTDNKAVHFFGEMADDASKNVPLVADAFTHILSWFQTIAKVASPFLHEMIKDFDGFFASLDARDSSPEGLKKLEAFFSKAEQYARDIGKMVLAFVGLMAALGRDSAPSGGTIIESLTNSMNEASDWVNSHSPEVRQFFHETAEVVKQIGLLLFGVGLTMVKAFNPSSTAALQQFLTQIFLPALTKVLDILGWITTAFLNIAKSIPGGTAALQVLAGIVVTILGVGKLYGPVNKVFDVMKGLAAATKAFTEASGLGRITAAWEAFTGVMKKAKQAADEAAGAQDALNTAEGEGAGVATADAAAQTGVDVAEGAGGVAGATGGAGGFLARLGLSGVAGGAAGGATVAAGTILGGAAVIGGVGALIEATTPGRETNRGIPTERTGGRDLAENQLADFGKKLSKIKGNLSDLPKDKLTEIHKEAEKLGNDKSLSHFKTNLEQIAKATDPSLVATKRWSEKMREYFKSLGPAATSVAETFKDINNSTGSILKQTSEVVADNSKKIAEDLGTNTKQGKDALIANFGAAVVGIQNAMEEGKVSTGKGMQEIGKLVASALKEYGINPSQVNKYVANTGQLLTTNKNGGLVELPGRADGGWMEAARGGRIYHTAEGGHDEMVLSTDPSKAKRQSALLGAYLKRSPGVASMAAGGFVADPGTNFSVGKEPEIVAALRRLSAELRTTIYGISGYRSPQHSVEVGGFSNDPHTRGEAADIGVGANTRESAYKLSAATLKRAGLERPFYPASANEVNHVQLIGSMLGTSGNVGTSLNAPSGYEIDVPKVKGLTGNLKKIAQGALNKVTVAANQYLEKTIGSLAIPGAPNSAAPSGTYAGVNGKGGSSSANEKLGKEMMIKDGFAASEWPDLQKLWTQESGWSDTAENNPSMGWLADGNASGIPQADGHGNVYPKGIPRPQIAWGLKYIRERYRTIAKAWAYENAPGKAPGYAIGGLLRRASMAMGGMMAPWGGRPVPIEAHEGERVVNPMQWNEVAKLSGTTPGGLDHHLGYDGKPKQSFADGGLPRVVRSWAQPSSTGSPSLPNLETASTEALSSNGAIYKLFQTISNGFKSLSKIQSKSDAFGKAVIPFINSITDEQTGVLARLTTAFTVLTAKINASSAKANFKTMAGGRLVSSSSPLEQTESSLTGLETERKNLETQGKILSETQKNIKKRIESLSHGKQTAKVKKEIQQLVGAYNSVAESQVALEEQVSSNLEASAQATAERIQDMADAIQQTGSVETSRAGLSQTRAQVSVAQGNYGQAGAFALTGYNTEISSANTQLGQYRSLLGEAEKEGNATEVSSLTSAIIQLEATVETNTQAIKDNTASTTQEYISQVSRQGQFATGVYGGLISLLQTAGQITGSTNAAGEASLYKQSNTTLEGTNSSLINGPQGLNSFLSGLGVTGVPNLAGLSPEGLVGALSGANIPAIEAQMDPAQQAVFEQIVSSLLTNTEQIETNNEQLAILNGQLLNPQSFSSAPWTQFRSAVFTGMGGLMPNIATALGVAPGSNPALTGAGLTSSDGAAPMIGEQHIHVTEPTEVADPAHLGSAVAYQMKIEK